MYKDGPNYTGKSRDNVRLAANAPMVLGKGYWIIADKNVTLKADGDVSAGTGITTRTQFTRTISDPSIAGFCDALLPDLVGGIEKKIMMGNTFPRVFQWEDLDVIIGNAPAAFPQGLYDPTGYVYDVNTPDIASGQNYRAITANTPGISGEIKPYQGFWIKDLGLGNGSGLKLGIPFEK